MRPAACSHCGAGVVLPQHNDTEVAECRWDGAESKRNVSGQCGAFRPAVDDVNRDADARQQKPGT